MFIPIHVNEEYENRQRNYFQMMKTTQKQHQISNTINEMEIPQPTQFFTN